MYLYNVQDICPHTLCVTVYDEFQNWLPIRTFFELSTEATNEQNNTNAHISIETRKVNKHFRMIQPKEQKKNIQLFSIGFVMILFFFCVRFLFCFVYH